LDKATLISRWANDSKRAEFIDNYEDWGVYTSNAELGLTYYRYTLPTKAQMLVMHHNSIYGKTETFYLQTGDKFVPSSVSKGTLNAYLKDSKTYLISKLRQEEVEQCKEFMIYGKSDEDTAYKPVNIHSLTIGGSRGFATHLNNFKTAKDVVDILAEYLREYKFSVKIPPSMRTVYTTN
jgi:hypothetical protein